MYKILKQASHILKRKILLIRVFKWASNTNKRAGNTHPFEKGLIIM